MVPVANSKACCLLSRPLSLQEWEVLEWSCARAATQETVLLCFRRHLGENLLSLVSPSVLAVTG